MNFAVKLPLLDVPSFGDLGCLLACGHHHVTHTSSRKSVQVSLDPLHRGDTQILGSCVVSTVDHSSYLKIPGKSGISHRGPTTSSPRHPELWKGTERTIYSCPTVPSHSLYPEQSFVKANQGIAVFFLKPFNSLLVFLEN